jgi:hypothetical protein
VLKQLNYSNNSACSNVKLILSNNFSYKKLNSKLRLEQRKPPSRLSQSCSVDKAQALNMEKGKVVLKLPSIAGPCPVELRSSLTSLKPLCEILPSVELCWRKNPGGLLRLLPQLRNESQRQPPKANLPKSLWLNHPP